MYSRISDLGKSVDYHSEQANPLSYCLYPNYNSQWIHGSTSVNQLNTPYCDPCQNIMAERCGKNWDDVCDIYVNHNCDTSWPNTGAIDQISQRKASHFLKFTPSVGDNLIRNSVERSLFHYPNSNVKLTQFDPNVAGSPFYKTYSSNTLIPEWTLHPTLLKEGGLHDEHEHVKLMLNHPQACFDLLARFDYLNKQKSPQFSMAMHKTKSSRNLLNFLKLNSHVFDKFNSGR